MKAMARPAPFSFLRVAICLPGWTAVLLGERDAGGSIALLAKVRSSCTCQVIPHSLAGVSATSGSGSCGPTSSRISRLSGVPAMKNESLSPGYMSSRALTSFIPMLSNADFVLIQSGVWMTKDSALTTPLSCFTSPVGNSCGRILVCIPSMLSSLFPWTRRVFFCPC